MRIVSFCSPATKVWLWAADSHSICSPVWKQRCSEARFFQHPRYFYIKEFSYIHSRVAEVWGHLIWTDRDLFSASVSGLIPNKPSGHPPRKAPLELQRLSRIAPASSQYLKILLVRFCCLSTSPQSLSLHVQFDTGQEPHDCLHPGSFSSGEVLGQYLWGRSLPGPCLLTACPARPLSWSALPLPPPAPASLFSLCEWPPWCTGHLQASGGQTLLQGHLSW